MSISFRFYEETPRTLAALTLFIALPTSPIALSRSPSTPSTHSPTFFRVLSFLSELFRYSSITCEVSESARRRCSWEMVSRVVRWFESEERRVLCATRWLDEYEAG